MAKKRLYLKIFGEVKGVSFRYWAREKARELGLAGWARNVEDGTVECEVGGEEEALKKFLEWAKKGPSWAKVERAEERWGEFENEFRGFDIKF